MEIIIASHNHNKLKEIRQILPEFRLLSLRDLNYEQEIPETGSSLVVNASIKSRTIAQHFKMPVIADDTGLIVNSLDGDPGVYSARYAGDGASDRDNWRLLLRNLEGERQREAYFKTVISFIDPLGIEHIFSGSVEGKIATQALGEEGFGYDPVFIPNGYTESFGQLPSSVKNKISHRANALRKLQEFFADQQNFLLQAV
jgi:XTP/dITP diphosphohydrolase